MLLNFGVHNHLSLRDAQELSLIPSPALKDDEAGLLDCPAAPDGWLLPAAVIYGANASGKSNIVDALEWMQEAVLSSHYKGIPRGFVGRRPFKLDPVYASKPSGFDAD